MIAQRRLPLLAVLMLMFWGRGLQLCAATEFGVPHCSRLPGDSPSQTHAHVAGMCQAAEAWWICYPDRREVTRYDGIRRANFSIPFPPRDVVDAAGRIWVVGEQNAGYLTTVADPTRDRARQFHSVHTDTADRIEGCLQVDGAVYLRHSSGVSVCESGDMRFRYVPFTVEGRSFERAAVTSACALNGKLYVGTDCGVYKLAGDRWLLVECEGENVSGIVVVDGQLAVLLYDVRGGLYLRYRGRKHLVWKTESASMSLGSPVALPDQTIVVPVQGRGVLHVNLQGELVEIYDDRVRAALHRPQACAVSRGRGVIWISTYRGVYRIWPQLPFRRLVDRHGLPAGLRALSADGSGGLWCGTTRGVFQFRSGTPAGDLFRRLSAAGNGTLGDPLQFLTCRLDGRAKTYLVSDRGLFRVNAERFAVTSLSEPLPDRGGICSCALSPDQSVVFLRTRSGRLGRIGLDCELEQWYDGAVQTEPTDGGWQGTFGGAWMTASAGPRRFAELQFSPWANGVRVTEFDSEANQPPREHLIGQQQRWFGVGRLGQQLVALSGAGLHVVDWQAFPPKLRLTKRWVAPEVHEGGRAFVIDQSVYLFGRKGLTVWDAGGDELQLLYDCPMQGDRQPDFNLDASFHADADRFYVGNDRQIRVADRVDLRPEDMRGLPQVDLRVELRHAAARPHRWQLAKWSEEVEAYYVPCGVAVRVKASPVELYGEQSNSFAFELRGQSNGISEVQSGAKALFTGLSPGRYRLTVSGHGVMQLMPRQLDFIVRRPWVATVEGSVTLILSVCWGVGVIVWAWNWSLSDKLERSRNEYRTIFDQSLDVILITSADGQVLQANPAAVEFFRAESVRDLIGVQLARFFPPGPFPPPACAGVTTMQGDRLYAEVQHKAMGDGRMQWHIRDQTSEEAARKQLHRTASLEAMGLMAGAVAHDFRNVLNSVSISNEYLLMQAQGLGTDDRVMGVLKTIQDTVDHGVALANRLTQVGNVDTERRVAPLQLSPVVASIYQSYRLVSDRIEHRLEMHEDDFVVLGNADELMRVLINVYENAVHAIHDAGVITLGVKASPVTWQTHECVEVFVRDTGCGMPPNVLRQIFDPYYTTRENGTGLGLYSCRELLTKMDGGIEVESEQGQGTTVRLYLRRSGIDSQLEARLPEGLRILVVDDQPQIQREMVLSLGLHGCQVMGTESPCEAKSLLVQHTFDVLLTDFSMLPVNGAELAQHAREVQPRIVTLLMTGYADILQERHLLAAECVEHILAKPVSTADIVRALAETTDAISTVGNG